jgi:hypothetical protein
MRIIWQGEDLGEWRGKPKLKEQRRIKDELGWGPVEFLENLGEDDPYAVSIFVAIMRTRKTGEVVNLEDVDGEPEDLDIVFSDEEKKTMKDAQGKLGKDLQERVDAILAEIPTPDGAETSTP